MVAGIFFTLVIAVFIIPKTQASKYEIILEKIEPALGVEDNMIKFETLRVKKFNHSTYVIDGKYLLKTPLDDSHGVLIIASNFQGGQYKKLFEKGVNELCTAMYDEKNRIYFEKLQERKKYPVPWLTCPYPAGPNEISNLLLEDYGSVLPPHVPGGEKWKMEVNFIKNDVVIGGFNIYCTLRSEKSLLNGGGMRN